MTILICDDITALAYYLEHLTRTDEPGPGNYSLSDALERVQECADRMTAETLAVVHEMRALRNEQTPMFGFHRPGLITPRRVDNADRSGANLLKRVNSVNFFQLSPFQAPGTQPVKAGGFFCPFHFWAVPYHFRPHSFQEMPHLFHFRALLCTFGNYLFSP